LFWSISIATLIATATAAMAIARRAGSRASHAPTRIAAATALGVK
jgi:hypothetical protein